MVWRPFDVSPDFEYAGTGRKRQLLSLLFKENSRPVTAVCCPDTGCHYPAEVTHETRCYGTVFIGALPDITAAAAAEKFTVELEMNNGELTPPVNEGTRKTPIRIKISNTGTELVEFESTQLRKEKVLSGASSVVVIAPLKLENIPFDDFHLSHPAGGIIAE